MLRRFILLLALAGAASAGEKLTLDQVLTDVRARNPEIGAVQARAAAQRERMAQAGAWDDPVVGIEAMRNDTRFFDYDSLELQLTQ
jgi:hypothetical protein